MPFPPQRIISLLEDTVPDDTVITCDAGENRLFMMQWFRTRSGGEYLQPAAGGGMGYAVPAAMAARLADPDRPVVAVCGDGGFAMSIHALMTAIQEDLPIAVLVFNNGALGWVLHGMGNEAVAANFAGVRSRRDRPLARMRRRARLKRRRVANRAQERGRPHLAAGHRRSYLVVDVVQRRGPDAGRARIADPPHGVARVEVAGTGPAPPVAL